jgi:hypothetical protein
VRFWYDRDALLRPHHQCTGGTGAPREDQGHSGLVDTQEHDIIEELLWAVQLLQAVHPGFFSAWSTAEILPSMGPSYGPRNHRKPLIT